jgi:hypothetical protein
MVIAIIAHGPLVQAQAFLQYEPSIDGQFLDGLGVRLLDGVPDVWQLQEACAANLGGSLGYVVAVHGLVTLGGIPSDWSLAQVEFEELAMPEFHSFCGHGWVSFAL